MGMHLVRYDKQSIVEDWIGLIGGAGHCQSRDSPDQQASLLAAP